MPIIVLGKFFTYNAEFGAWTKSNYLVYTFMAYQIYLLKGLINDFPTRFREEKYWRTLAALIIAPFNRFNLLFGIFLNSLIFISVPFIIFFIMCYIIYPISFITFIFIILFYLLITIIFSSLGLIIGIFAISREGTWYFVLFAFNLTFWLSCITYPYQIFPDAIQFFINFNPLYWIFDVLRAMWIENNILITFSLHFSSVFILLSCSLTFPFFGVIIFNLIYKKYGIVGY